MRSLKNHYYYLDGLRAILAGAVVISHILLTLGKTKRFAALSGHYAVDCFIVLSGFCLTIPFANKKILPNSSWVLRFFLKRFVRIVIPY